MVSPLCRGMEWHFNDAHRSRSATGNNSHLGCVRCTISRQPSTVSLSPSTGRTVPNTNPSGTPRSPRTVRAKLDMQELDRAVDFFQNGLAPSTRRTYNSAKKRYLAFCKDKDLPAIPVSEQQLCRFVSYLANKNLSHTSIKCYLAAIRHLHIAEGVDVPHMHCMARLEQVLRGVKSVQSKRPKRPQARLPITPELLRRLREVWLVGGGDLDGKLCYGRR